MVDAVKQGDVMESVAIEEEPKESSQKSGRFATLSPPIPRIQGLMLDDGPVVARSVTPGFSHRVARWRRMQFSRPGVRDKISQQESLVALTVAHRGKEMPAASVRQDAQPASETAAAAGTTARWPVWPKVGTCCRVSPRLSPVCRRGHGRDYRRRGWSVARWPWRLWPDTPPARW